MAKKKARSSAKATRSTKGRKSAQRSAKKKSAKRSSTKTKSPAKKRAAKNPSKSKKKVTASKSTPKRKRTTLKRPAALGRPRVPGTADLDEMFRNDYEARQVFAFLGVKTVKELEEHPPEEIVERLTGPMVRTVERIRKALAVNNRYLAGDQKFAVQFTKQVR